MKDPREKDAPDLIKDLTRHDNVRLTCSGNAAILCAFSIAKSSGKKQIIIPDQGGWMSYKTYPPLLGLEVTTIETDHGVIDPEKVKSIIEQDCALIVPSFAGYFAEQPIEAISRVTKSSGAILIEDASGGIGDKVLCNGDYADIILGSFGDWKVIDLGFGGFISVKDKELYEQGKEILSSTRFNTGLDKLIEKLKAAKGRLAFLMDRSEKIKKDLYRYEIIHRDKRGLNVVVRFSSEDEKKKLIDYCDENKIAYVICPKSFKVNCKAISLEIKRLTR